MQQLSIKENWDELAQRLRGRFSKITTDDVSFMEGQYDKMIAKIASRLGRSSSQVQTLIDSMNYDY
jgi:uncharacterized protein YjbJ (UPF0337 family)